MDSSLILIFLIFFQAFLKFTKSEYIVDIVDVDWNITTTNKFDMFWEISHPSRGVFAVSGYCDIKEDINTDKTMVRVEIYYSKNGITYTLTPFRVLPITYTNSINKVYPVYLKDIVTECCENPIDFDDKFISPLTKRHITCNNCVVSGVNFPTHLRPGFYRLIGISSHELEFVIWFTLKVENE